MLGFISYSPHMGMSIVPHPKSMASLYEWNVYTFSVSNSYAAALLGHTNRFLHFDIDNVFPAPNK